MLTHQQRQLSRVGAAFVGALLIALLSGCASKDKLSPTETAASKVETLKDDIRNVVQDPARAEKLAGLLDETVALLQEHNRELETEEARVGEMLKRYETTPDDLRAFFAPASAARAERSRRAVGLLEQMRAATTPDEWTELRKVREKTLKAALEAARPH